MRSHRTQSRPSHPAFEGDRRMTMSAITQRSRADIVRRQRLHDVSMCHRAGLTFYEWFWGQTLEPIDRDCWEWARAMNPQTGYGWVFVPGVGLTTTHRAAWALVHGAVPDDLHVLHKCDNRRCVRPSHLYVGTAVDNAKDRDERYYGRSDTHCPKGHELSEPALRPTGSRLRVCRLCRQESSRRYYAAHRAELCLRSRRKYMAKKASESLA